ncbi:Wzz/FepE/Etk N-terminal domain-containing protein [uncultured Neptuniibacter sp.]|uniref:Wzz/FepE/Etk N-terminal domain-containing protein n=1 Tax=uncultured Neptuniibacter sp. TaxID=502143 RepID=UPI00260AAF3D|nr:Wzz/FepE/Etk N-terminal domain-containing protein [uncultured Neptuniibacter sp.]
MSEHTLSTQNDEIDLFQLIENLWKEKLLIILITFCFTLGGGLYAFFKTPTYQASANLKQLEPESISQLKSLKLYSDIAPNSLLSEYVRLLNNPSFRQAFIDSANSDSKQLYQADSSTLQQKMFSQRFSYTNHSSNKKSNSLFPYTITFKAHTPALASNELQRYIDTADTKLYESLKQRHSDIKQQKAKHIEHLIKTTKNRAINYRQDKITVLEAAHELKKLTIQSQLDAAKFSYKISRKDRIARLESAIRTAEILKIRKPVALRDLNGSANKNVAIEVNNSNSPLYLRGTELLSAELQEISSRNDDLYLSQEIRDLEKQLLLLEQNHQIEQLKARKDDSPFNEDLQKLKAQLDSLQLESFPEMKFKFSAAPALAAASPIAPKKPLILALSVMLGGMIGIIAALIRSSLTNRKLRNLNS